MKIAFNEVWNFMELVRHTNQPWSYSLHAGKVSVRKISTKLMHGLKTDASYDTELLPSLFTFREILWQPDVHQEASACLSPLQILKAFCEEKCEELTHEKSQLSKLYIPLINGLGKCCNQALKNLAKDGSNANQTLGYFRICAFPIVRFFIHHPKNRGDYFVDAENRLNYAVKVMLTQFPIKHLDLLEPYWEISLREKI